MMEKMTTSHRQEELHVEIPNELVHLRAPLGAHPTQRDVDGRHGPVDQPYLEVIDGVAEHREPVLLHEQHRRRCEDCVELEHAGVCVPDAPHAKTLELQLHRLGLEAGLLEHI